MDMLEHIIAKKLYGSGGGGGGSGGGEEWIGDGNTHLWISLNEGRTSPKLGCLPKGTVTVDWGDGSTPDTLSGTSTTSVLKWTPSHNYGKGGDYVITLTVDGEMSFYGNATSDEGSAILRYASHMDKRNNVYKQALRKLEIGNGVTMISNSAFSHNYDLTSVVISGGVTSIGAYTFSSCYGMVLYDFTNHAAVPALVATSAFDYIPSDCEIRVPATLVDEWKAATNWSSYADKIVGV